MTETISGVKPVAFPTNKWAVMAAVRISDTAAVHLAIHEQPTDFLTIRAFARVLGSIVEQVAREAFVGGFDWSFDAASRAGAIVESTLRGNPAPFGGDEAAWAAWRELVVKLSVYKLHAGVALVDVENNDARTAGAQKHLISTTTAVESA